MALYWVAPPLDDPVAGFAIYSSGLLQEDPSGLRIAGDAAKGGELTVSAFNSKFGS
jgi:hypothetical protein